MSILKVARMGHPVLRKVARKVEPAEIRTPAFQQLVDDLMETMREYDGIGLAAPQVHESIRLAVIGIEEGKGEDCRIRAFPVINPEVTPTTTETGEDWEGCLSVPNIRGRVSRPNAITLRALDRRGNKVELDFEGFPARVVQHELDHLDGILFVDRMKSLETLCFLEEYSKHWAED